MGLIIGIDIGGSTTKIVGFTEDKKQAGTLKVTASDQVTCTYGALGSFLHAHRLALTDISQIILTGVGASFFDDTIHGIPTRKVPEFQAIGLGGLRLAGLEEAYVVSMGTGTAFVRADKNQVTHLGGSGVGGGTLFGLSSKLLSEQDISVVSRLAMQGDPANVDLMVADIFRGDIPSLSAELTASNFGKMKSGASDSDIAAALFNLVYQTIGMLAVFACQKDDRKDIVLTGSLAGLAPAKPVFDLMSRLYEVNFILPDNAVFATAIGAVMSAFTS